MHRYILPEIIILLFPSSPPFFLFVPRDFTVWPKNWTHKHLVNSNAYIHAFLGFELNVCSFLFKGSYVGCNYVYQTGYQNLPCVSKQKTGLQHFCFVVLKTSVSVLFSVFVYNEVCMISILRKICFFFLLRILEL